MDSAVLVLNQNYEPLNVCDMRRAIILVIVGKAEILENSLGYIRTPSMLFPRPSVIKLLYMVHRPHPRARLSRQEVFRRDNFTCQYCGAQTYKLTLDHVIPRHLGGRHAWDNLVSACHHCNRRKGGKTPEQAHMTLLRKPREPRSSYRYLFQKHLNEHQRWEKFIQGWM